MGDHLSERDIAELAAKYASEEVMRHSAELATTIDSVADDVIKLSAQMVELRADISHIRENVNRLNIIVSGNGTPSNSLVARTQAIELNTAACRRQCQEFFKKHESGEQSYNDRKFGILKDMTIAVCGGLAVLLGEFVKNKLWHL